MVKLRVLLPPEFKSEDVAVALEVERRLAERLAEEIALRARKMRNKYGYVATIVGDKVSVTPAEKKIDKIMVEPLPVTIEFRDIDTGVEHRLQLPPGTYNVGRLPDDVYAKVSKKMNIPRDAVAIYDDKGNVYAVIGRSSTVKERHARLHVTDDGVKIESDYGIAVTRDGSVNYLWGGEDEVTAGTLVDLGDKKLHFTRVGDDEGTVVDKIREREKEEKERREAAKRARRTVRELAEAAEEVARSAARVAAIRSAGVYGAAPALVGGYFKLFMFIFNHRDAVARGGIRLATKDKSVMAEFIDAISELVKNVVDVWDGKLVSAGKVDPEVVARGLAESEVFNRAARDIAARMMNVDPNDPDPVAVLKLYSEVIRLTGMGIPALVASSNKEAEDYLRRMDKVLVGAEQPKTELEALVAANFSPLRRIARRESTEARRRGEAVAVAAHA